MTRLLVIIVTLLFMGNTMNIHNHEFRVLSEAPDTEFYGDTTPVDLGVTLLHTTHPPCQTQHGHSSPTSACCCHPSIINGRFKNLNGPEGTLISVQFYALAKKTTTPIIELPTPPPRFI